MIPSLPPLPARLEEKVAGQAGLPPPGRRSEIRRRWLLSQADLADALGVNVQSIGRWERGERHPRGELAARYGQLLVALEERAKVTSP